MSSAIIIPDDILCNYLSENEIEKIKSGHTGIFLQIVFVFIADSKTQVNKKISL